MHSGILIYILFFSLPALCMTNFLASLSAIYKNLLNNLTHYLDHSFSTASLTWKYCTLTSHFIICLYVTSARLPLFFERLWFRWMMVPFQEVKGSLKDWISNFFTNSLIEIVIRCTNGKLSLVNKFLLNSKNLHV